MNITYVWAITGMKMAPSLDGLTDLTEAEVIAWIQPIYPMDHPNEVVEEGIQNQITPTNEDAPMPWAPEPTPVPPVS